MHLTALSRRASSRSVERHNVSLKALSASSGSERQLLEGIVWSEPDPAEVEELRLKDESSDWKVEKDDSVVVRPSDWSVISSLNGPKFIGYGRSKSASHCALFASGGRHSFSDWTKLLGVD